MIVWTYAVCSARSCAGKPVSSLGDFADSFARLPGNSERPSARLAPLFQSRALLVYIVKASRAGKLAGHVYFEIVCTTSHLSKHSGCHCGLACPSACPTRGSRPQSDSDPNVCMATLLSEPGHRGLSCVW